MATWQIEYHYSNRTPAIQAVFQKDYLPVVPEYLRTMMLFLQHYAFNFLYEWGSSVSATAALFQGPC